METAYRRTRWHPPSRPEEGWFLPSDVAVFVPEFVRLVLLTASLIKSLSNQEQSSFVFFLLLDSSCTLLFLSPSLSFRVFRSFRLFIRKSEASRCPLWKYARKLQRYVCHCELDLALNDSRRCVCDFLSRADRLTVARVSSSFHFRSPSDGNFAITFRKSVLERGLFDLLLRGVLLKD